MGFFSEDDKVDVFANTCHLAEVDTHALKDAVLYAILSGKPIASCILNVTMNQMSTQVDHFYSYAKNFYTLGLPETSYENSLSLPEQDVADAIATDTNKPYGVVLEYHYVTPLIPVLVVTPYLTTARGWNPTTGLITVLPEEYQFKIGLPYFYEGWLDTVELNEDYTQVTITYLVKRYKIVYDGDPDIPYFQNTAHRQYIADFYFTDIQELPAGLNYGRDYCIAAYRVLDSEGLPSEELYWWYYDISSNLYPALIPETILDDENVLLPVVPIRYKNQSMVREEVQDTELYKTSKKLLKKIGVSIDDIAEMVEENPNVADIDHAYIMFGVDLQSNEQASIRYLVEFFDHIADKAGYTVIDNINSFLTQSTTNSWKSGLSSYNKYKLLSGVENPISVAKDETNWAAADGTVTTMGVTVNSYLGTFEEYGLRTDITHTYIRSEIIAGSIGEIGYAIKSWDLGSMSTQPLYGIRGLDDSVLILKLQISSNVYKKITVKGLVHSNYVHEGYSVKTTLTHVIQNEDEHNFIIPLHYNLAEKLPPTIRSQLYQDSLVLVLNSVVFTSVSWYQTHFFKFITMAVAVVLTVYTGVGGAWLGGLVAAAEIGTMAVLMYLLETVIVSWAISKALDYVALWVGPEIMAILSVAVIALSFLSQGGTLQGIASIASYMPTAEKLLLLSSSMLSSASNAYGTLIEGIQEDYEKEVAKQEALWEELEDYEDLLEDPTDAAINLLEAQSYSKTLKQASVNDPSEFYDLTIHTGNIGTLSLQSPTLFHSIALTLPEPDSLLVD